MKIFHIFNELSVESGYYDRLLRMNKTFSQYCVSCDKKNGTPFILENFKRIKYFQFPKFESIKEYLFIRAVTDCFENNFSSSKIDIIHSYFSYPNASAGRVIANKYKIPHVVTVRGSDVLLYPKQNLFLQKAVSRNLKSADKVICVSNHLKDACIELGVLSEKIVHMPDGHDETIFYYDPKIQKENIILFVGNLISVKNPIFLLKSFNKFLNFQPDFKLLIAGQGNLKNEMIKYINQNNLKNNVEFLGQLNSKELSLYMKKSKLLFLPSISEGWPNVIQEALACGTPVVASKVGGIPEIIRKNINGNFCNIESEDETSVILNETINRKFEISDLQELPNKFTREIIIKQLFLLYNSLNEK